MYRYIFTIIAIAMSLPFSFARQPRVGITLSGGGALGYAHIGVLQALEEHGIHPDCISGSSMGAIIGTLYAAGYSPKEMLAIVQKDKLYRINKLLTLQSAFTTTGMSSHKSLHRILLQLIPHNSFDSLPRRLTVCVTNLDSGESEYISSGDSLAEYVVASASKKPIGVCLDEGAKGDSVSVALPGCAESTFVCRTSANVSAGDSLYASAGGKVSPVAGDGAYKVGVALCSAAAGCPVEIDPQGFGERAWQVHSCGLYVWTGATSSETLASGELGEGDIAFASIAAAGGSEKSVSAIVSDGGITFSLDAAGTASSTKIAWMVLRKN